MTVLGRPISLVILAAGLGIATTALVWLGFRATGAWRSSVEQLVERRASEKVALLAAALNQDMKGAGVRVLVPLNQHHIALDAPYDLATTFASAFARFPYPESFFAWRNSADSIGRSYVFNRADRTPPWAPARAPVARYPVVILEETTAIDELILRSRVHLSHRTRFFVFDTVLAGDPYQVVVHLMHSGSDQELYGMVGFTVNLDWVRQYYFDELTRQVSSIGGEGDDLALAIIDDRGSLVTSTAPLDATRGETRRFPLLFFDASLLPGPPGERPKVVYWKALVSTSGERALAASAIGADRLLAVISLAAVATLAALLLTARAVRVNAQLATMRSEFVSAVTHELKTPLSLIRLVADTLSQGRYDSSTTVRDYAGLLAKQSSSLALLIDNLLTYARMSDLDSIYSFTVVDVHDLIDDALERCQVRLRELGFTIAVEVPAELPPVNVDRAAVLHAIENVLDNALKYSEGVRALTLSGREQEGYVHIEVSDRGPGIPPDERVRVFDKFYRGRTVRAGGSGLGLTIVDRVIREHGGAVTIRSGTEGGTTVDIALPAAASKA